MADIRLDNPGFAPEELDVLLAQRRRRRWIAVGLIVVVLVAPTAGWIGWKLYQRGPNGTEHYQQALARLGAGDLRAAVIGFKNVLKVRPGDGAARLQLGEVYLLMGDGVSAEKELRQAKNSGVDSTVLKLKLLRAKFLQGSYDEVFAGLATAAMDNTESLLLRGEALLAVGQFDDAERDFEQVLAEQTANTRALHGLSLLAMVTGDLEVAERHITAALRVSEADIGSWFIKGDIAFANRDFSSARLAFERALDIDAGHHGAKLALSQSLLALGDTAAADAHLAELYRASPKMPVVNYLRAVAAHQRGDIEEAKSALRTVLSVAPQSRDSHFLLASILYAERDLEAAEASLREVLSLAPEHLESYKMLAAIQMDGQRPLEAAATLSARVNDAPDDVQLLTMLGNAYLRGGQFDKASQMLTKAAQLAPDEAGIRTQLAVSRFGMGEGEAALRDMQTVVELDSAFVRADLVIAAMHLDRGEFSEAIEAVRRLAAKQPENPMPHNLIGGAYEGLKDITLATEAYERALSIDGDFVAASLNLARLAHQSGDAVAARTRYTAVLERQPHQPDVLVRLAQIALNDGDDASAVELLERARQHNPEDLVSRMMLTHRYGQSGNAKISLTIAREAFQLAPTLGRAIILLARAELRNGSGQGAVERLLSLAGDFPKSADVAFELARAHVVTREMSFARQGFERVLALDENHVGAKLGLGQVALKEDKPERAIEIARQFQQSYPDRVGGFALEGDAQLSVPNPDAAIIAYKAAFALQRLNALVLGLSRAHLANGDVVKARETLNIWLREHPDDVAVRTAFADFALTLGDVSTAISHYERIVEQVDDQVGVLNNLAYLYHQRNDDRALGLAKKAYSLAPTHPGVLDTYGWLLVENGEANRGLPILQRSVERSPKNGEHRYHLGVALAKVSRHKEARDMLLSVVKMDGDFPEKEKAAELLGYLE